MVLEKMLLMPLLGLFPLLIIVVYRLIVVMVCDQLVITENDKLSISEIYCIAIVIFIVGAEPGFPEQKLSTIAKLIVLESNKSKVIKVTSFKM